MTAQEAIKENDKIYIHLASHAIGLDHKKPYKRHGKLYYRPYRNYYDASPKNCEVWEVMAAAGYAKQEEKIGMVAECTG